MKSFYFSLLTALGFFFALPSFSQTEKNMVVHFKDNTCKEIPVANIDSIYFKSEEAIPHFDISIDEVHPLYVEFTVSPLLDREGTYNMMIVDKANFDLYESDEAVVADDMKFFQELADGYGATLSEIIEQFVIKGDFNDFHVGLLPDTEYVMWAYGLNTDGTQTTPLQKVVFRTAKATHIENKIAIDVKRSANSIEATYTPDDNNLHYTAGLMSAKDAMAPAFIPIKMQQALSNQIADYVLGDEPLINYLQERTEHGVGKGIFNGIDPNGKYYIVAAYLDNECCLCSDLTILASTPDGLETVPLAKSLLQSTSGVKRQLSGKFQMKDQIRRFKK